MKCAKLMLAMAAFAAAGYVVAGCAATPRDDFALFADQPDPARIDADFAARIAARYSAAGDKAAIERDLSAHGFHCADVPPVEARGDYLIARCTLARPHGLCTDAWGVDLRYANGDRVTPRGEFRRACVAGASPIG